MLGQLVIAAIVLDALFTLGIGISGTRQIIAWVTILVFVAVVCTSTLAGISIRRKIIYSSVLCLLALGMLVASISGVRAAQLRPNGGSTECEMGIGGQMICP